MPGQLMMGIFIAHLIFASMDASLSSAEGEPGSGRERTRLPVLPVSRAGATGAAAGSCMGVSLC